LKKNPFGKLRQRLSLFGYTSYTGTIKHSIDHTTQIQQNTYKREFNQLYGNSNWLIDYIKALLRALWTMGIATKGKPSPHAATRIDI
jgi:hypothetical protein